MKKITIEVDDVWIEKLPDFVIRLQQWLTENRPCENCLGDGFVPGAVIRHFEEPPDDIGCPVCHGYQWRSPI